MKVILNPLKQLQLIVLTVIIFSRKSRSFKTTNKDEPVQEF